MSISPGKQLSLPYRIIRFLLPVLMGITIIASVVAGIRLSSSLGYPLPGFVMMWDKSAKLYVVSWLTPTNWTGIREGLRVNDKILCINGYNPSPDSVVYGVLPQFADVKCANGGKHYTQLLMDLSSQTSPTVEMTIGRGVEVIIEPTIPVIKFTLNMLMDVYLPSLLLSLAMLTIGGVVYKANPSNEVNLLFTAFVTLLAALTINIPYTVRISPEFQDARLIALILAVPWIPFLGSVLLHLIILLTNNMQMILKRGLFISYILSGLFSLIGVLIYIFNDNPLTYNVNQIYNAYCAISYVIASFISFILLGVLSVKSNSTKIQSQARIILTGLFVGISLIIPYIVLYFSDAPVLPGINNLPFLGLLIVALFAYAILRYQLFRSKSMILSSLITISFYVVISSITFLVVGSNSSSYLPLFAVTLITGASFQVKRGPTAFFTRLLRRQVIDYSIVLRLSEELAQCENIKTTTKVVREVFKVYEVDSLSLWLLEQSVQIPDETAPLMPTRNISHPSYADNVMDTHSFTDILPTPLRRLISQEPPNQDIEIWSPLADKGRVVGMLALGPRRTGEIYDDQDMKLISILSRLIALTTMNIQQIEHAKLMAKRIVQVQDNERVKISQELHDTVLRFFHTLTFGLDELSEQSTGLAPQIGQWQNRISYQSNQLRGLITYLRAPEKLVQTGLTHSLQVLIEEIRSETDAEIELDSVLEIEQFLSTDACVAIYKVIREAINNAVKHSNATLIQLMLWKETGNVGFRAEDNGKGFSLALAQNTTVKGYSSLVDMRVHMDNIGGTLDIITELGSGTKIIGKVPIANEVGV